MTAQYREKLIYKGKQVGMSTLPLSQYFETLEEKPVFEVQNTACWRAYFGTWEIKDDKLYLIDFNGNGEGWQKVGIDYIFPGQKEVFANWFTGEIKIKSGELLEYVHAGFESLYEKETILTFQEGRFINSKTIDNRKKYNEGRKGFSFKRFLRNLFKHTV